MTETSRASCDRRPDQGRRGVTGCLSNCPGGREVRQDFRSTKVGRPTLFGRARPDEGQPPACRDEPTPLIETVDRAVGVLCSILAKTGVPAAFVTSDDVFDGLDFRAATIAPAAE